MSKGFVFSAVTVAVLLSVFPIRTEKSTTGAVKVRVCKAVEHEALNSVVSGITDYLKSQKNKKYDISVETCQGNMALASQIIAKFADSRADVVVTIGTVPSQASYKFAKKGQIKVVFSSVTNPGDISENLKNVNITGVSNFVPLRPQVKLFKQIQPNLKKLGIIFNTGEANSIYIIKQLDKICKDMEIKLVVQGISKISELSQTAERLAKRVDAIFISNDNMVLSGMSNIVAIGKKNDIPVYVSDTDQVKKGCVAALGPNQYDIGLQTGKIVKCIADGGNINTIPVEYPAVTELYINTKNTIKFPDDVKSQAKKVY